MCNRFKGSILESGAMISYCHGLSRSAQQTTAVSSILICIPHPQVNIRY